MSLAQLPAAGLQLFSFALGVLPVVAFLVALVLLDSYKLIRFRWVALLLALGAAIAVACRFLNPWLQALLGLDHAAYTRYCGPLLEELLKGLVIVYGIASRRLGFLVDAAIWGFAVGAGFAAAENVHYFLVLGDPMPVLWILRGFGTAVMHGAVVSIFAVLSKLLTDRSESLAPQLFLPGFALAAAIHSFYNHFVLSPTMSALSLLIILPLVFLLIFRVSERATQDWLGVGFDTDQELLDVIGRGKISETRIGRYLNALKRRFPGEIVADMLCLIRLRVELSIRAKGILLMQKAGFEPPRDPDIAAKIAEVKHLEDTIGITGLIALKPIFPTSSRDLWQMHMLERQ